MSARDGFNEYNIRKVETPNGELSQHRGFDQDMSADARRLLAEYDSITDISVGSRELTMWIRRCDLVNFSADGYDIVEVSAFGDPEERHSGGSTAIKLRPER